MTGKIETMESFPAVDWACYPDRGFPCMLTLATWARCPVAEVSTRRIPTAGGWRYMDLTHAQRRHGHTHYVCHKDVGVYYCIITIADKGSRSILSV